MINLTRPELSERAMEKLARYQAKVDKQADYLAQVEFAKDSFRNSNKMGNRTFDEVKKKLIQMSSGAERCHYCEDSKADEVEHILPKDVYPNLCYNWDNYLYSCGTCNSPKDNHCAIIDVDGNVVHLTPPENKPTQPPQKNVSRQPPPEIIDIDWNIISCNEMQIGHK